MRAPPRLVCRATTASARPLRTTGTASSRTAYDPYQRGSRDRCGRSSVSARLELGPLPLRRARPDDVVVVHGRAGARPALGDRDEVAGPRGQPQHEVGEGQVGDDLPVPHEQVQPLDVGGVEVGVAGDQVAQGGHPDSLGRAPRTAAAGPDRRRPPADRRPRARAGPRQRAARGRTADAGARALTSGRPGTVAAPTRRSAVHVRVQLRYDAAAPTVAAMLADAGLRASSRRGERRDRRAGRRHRHGRRRLHGRDPALGARPTRSPRRPARSSGRPARGPPGRGVGGRRAGRPPAGHRGRRDQRDAGPPHRDGHARHRARRAAASSPTTASSRRRSRSSARPSSRPRRCRPVGARGRAGRGIRWLAER